MAQLKHSPTAKKKVTEKSKKPGEPENFSWVEDNIAAMAYPYQQGNLEYLKKVAIAVLINYQNIPKNEQKKYREDEIAEAEERQYLADPKGYGIDVYHLYIEDYTGPSLELMIKMNDIIDNAKKSGLRVGMHCWAGCGRTGTMVACYRIYNRKDTEEAKNDSYVDDIIEETKENRPGSIELAIQVEALHTYQYYLQEVKKGNKDALKKTKYLVRLKEHRLKDLQPKVTHEMYYTLDSCKKARDYAVKKVK